ncbi:DNA polymerase III subunit beta [Hafnia phage yong3]|nr:DNA polymerase III subunit beta [Hafnia phage yong3]
MLESLKFVQGAVAKKEVVEGLTHFLIKDGVVKGFNGMIALAAPIPLDIECAPLATPMVKAITNCDDTVQLTLMSNGKLSIKAGGFRVAIPCTDKETPHVDPEGTLYEINGEQLIQGIKSVEPVMGVDASRRWTCGMLISNGSIYATNNVIIAQYWFGSPFPLDCVIPSAAVKEILRIKEVPTHIQACENNMTFHYPSGRWLRTQLMAMDWPDVNRVLEVESQPYGIDQAIFEGLDKIKPFAEEDPPRVYIEDGVMRTHYEPTEGAAFTINDTQISGVFAIEMLSKLKGIATTADLTRYPAPCTFFGENMRGVLMGVRL